MGKAFDFTLPLMDSIVRAWGYRGVENVWHGIVLDLSAHLGGLYNFRIASDVLRVHIFKICKIILDFKVFKLL